MGKFGADRANDGMILLARILLALLFVIFGWQKFTGFGGTIAYFTQGGVPMPQLAALVAVVMELGVGLAIVLGVFTRPFAVLLALYTIATALIGHPYWNMTGAAAFEAEINFYKNVSIMGGLFLLYLTGAGRYSVDRILRLA